MNRNSTTDARQRIAPLLLALAGLILAGGNIANLANSPGLDPISWWMSAFLAMDAGLMVVLGAALTLDPRPLMARRLLAAASLLWLFLLVAGVLLDLGNGTPSRDTAVLTALAAVTAIGLLALASTTDDVASGAQVPGPLARFGAVIAMAIGLLVAMTTLAVLIAVVTGVVQAFTTGTTDARLRLGAAVVIVLIPIVAFSLAALGTKLASGGTFQQQQAANRRNSLLLLLALVGTVAATGELIAAAVTASTIPSLYAAGLAAVVGVGAALGADRFGSNLLLDVAGAKPADPRAERTLLNVVNEVSVSAGIPAPKVYVIEDAAPNAFATGRDPSHAAVAVTRGLLDTMDREQLQGVIGHELGHIRNLDTRYSIYIAVLVGLVALVTDGFLRIVLELWKNGSFFWGGGDDIKETIAGFLTGIAVGTFLLVIALILRVAAPVFSMLVQAAASREREFLADATSVELTRNPQALERALQTLAGDRHHLLAANRGTQHLWFRNPIREGRDGWSGLFATHPSIGARVQRLRALQGMAGSNLQPAFAGLAAAGAQASGAEASGEALPPPPADPIPAELHAES